MLTDEKKLKIYKMLILGKSYREIAKKVHVSSITLVEIKNSAEFNKYRYIAYQSSKKYLENLFKVNRSDKIGKPKQK